MMRFSRLILALAAWPMMALAAPGGQTPLARPAIAPPPAWVDIAPLPKPPKDADGAATIDLLGDLQVNFTNEGDTVFIAQAWKIGTAQGLDDGALQVAWDPSLETLTIHRYRILRGSQVIDLLGDGSAVSVIQRETRMEDAMLDGRLTATMQPEDLRVGDVVDLAYSVTRRDPAMKGMSEYVAGPADGATFGRFRVRLVWGKDKQMHWRVLPGILAPKLKKSGQGNELIADLSDFTAPLPPESAPSRFGLVNAVEITEFDDWQGVSRTFAPLYAEAAKLAPDSPLHAEIDKIRAASPDPKRRAELALQLVQEQIRYLFLGMNAGGFIPASADQTWSRRFGDCKGKTVLLIAILNELGIEARPVLVNTESGDLVGDRLPTMEAFDHVIVEATIDGKNYFLDGTRLGDTSLARLRTPNYRFGLPVTAQGSALIAMVPEQLDRPNEVVTLTLDANKGLDLPAPASGEMRFHGESASNMRLRYGGYSQADRNRELRKLWRDAFDFIAPGKVGTRDDPETGDFVIYMTGTAQMEWTADLGTRWYEVDRSRLGWRFDIAREGELNKTAPYAVSFPDWWGSKTTIILPNKGKGFRLQGGSYDKTIGDLYQFHRKVDLVDGVVVMESETRTLAAELPADRAPRTRSEMAELAGNSVYVRAPNDYQKTPEELEQAKREDAAEARAAKGKSQPADSLKNGRQSP